MTLPKITHSNFKNLAKQNLSEFVKKENLALGGEEFEKLSGWTNVAMNFLDAKNSLLMSKKSKQIENLTKEEELTLANGMYKNFIMSYGKCFTSSGKGRITLDPKEIFSSKPELLKIHDRIIDSRNKYVAHSEDENGHDVAISYTEESDDEITLATTFTTLIPFGLYDSFIEVVEFCEQQVILKLNKKLDKIEEKIGKKIYFK